MPQGQTVFGLAGHTASWPQRVAAWSTAGVLPVHVTYCASVAHLHARLAADHDTRVVLLDGDLPLVDRDLLADVVRAGGVPIVVDGTRRRRDWTALGAAVTVSRAFDQAEMLAALTGVLRESPTAPTPAVPPVAPLVAVTGPGGTGASVVAIAVAQGMAVDDTRVLLMDCCLHAEQAMLHDGDGAQPGLVDVLELHAGSTPEHRVVRQLTMDVVERGYHLLPGLARARQWPRVRSGSLDAAVRSLRAAFETVVADVDADVEGEMEGGSLEVEERNTLARTMTAAADVVIVVWQPAMKGVHALVRTVVDLIEFGVETHRLLPVVNMALGADAAADEAAGAIRHLLDAVPGGRRVEPPLVAPTADIEACVRGGGPLPTAWASLLAGAATAMLERIGRRTDEATPTPVGVGSLGHWVDAPGPRR